MGGNRETELKLQVVERSEWEDLKRFVRCLPGVKASQKLQMLAVYFDTEDHLLCKNKFAYRIRQENGTWIATLKGSGTSEGGLHQRLEYNVEVKDQAPDLSVFPREALDGLSGRRLFTEEPFYPILQTEFIREAIELEVFGQRLEIALDEGEILAAGKKSPILEIELELKQGRPAVLLRLGANLARRFTVVVEERSKFARGLTLAGQKSMEKSTEEIAPGIRKSVRELLFFHNFIVKEKRADLHDAFQEAFTGFIKDRIPEPDKQSNLYSYQEKLALLLEIWAEDLEKRM